ncbi:Uncharacterised protein (plasmid) [Tsukamurella tyrosinosolvens]|uniref:DNA binding domain-containing protein, excisionase family n=1 Tax=Tsukamurella tyrosinosolvens TaxID=57704 RepID=A0A1H4VV93_TSUTY|nr:hypothetical protein [Tsukamurella tyrosinosolvens]KXO90618.1 hypothetical protein AXK58_22880 [Tsukamurella tyrosinosolvens]SEC84388.1 hypothetical protein SAMN04489793_3335 [Tsukamurella tyrosinosolvens]VEH90299.1 Uncharacterised protein [Tsukamurella tyrosinosolvens]
MDEFTSTEAADRLGVTPRRVRALLAAGDLIETRRVGGSVLIDARSVDHLERASASTGRSGRPWTAARAWAAITLLAGGEPDWLSTVQDRRLRAHLPRVDAETLVFKLRRRANVERYAGPTGPSALVVPTAGYALRDEHTAALFGLAAGAGDWRGYCASSDREAVIDELDLYASSRPDHTLLVVDDKRWIEAAAGPILVAVDLAESSATRERSAGLRALEEALRRV